MYPFSHFAHFQGSCCLDGFSFFWNKFFDFSGTFRHKSIKRNWNNCRWCINSGNLGSQINGFFIKVKWICEYSSFDISCKIEFNLSGFFNLRWFDIWKFYPVFKKAIAHPINIFISSITSSFLTCFFSGTCSAFSIFASFFSTSAILFTFSDEIIKFGSFNFTPESHLWCSRWS